MTQTYFATVARGLENIASQELENLGATGIKSDFAGVYFQGDKALLYRVNLWARTIYRVLVPFANLKSGNSEQLYQSVKKIDWAKYLQPDRTFAVICTGSNQHLNHTHFTALQIKNGIVDWQLNTFNQRSNIDPKHPDILINAHIDNHRCILSLDSSLTSLHRRGYRPAMGIAPLKETLAAALLEMANWQSELPFLDPMCGSGVLAIEAALKGLNIAPGLYRKSFGFQAWPDFDRELWQQILEIANRQKLSQLKAPIFASDRDLTLLQQAQSNANICGLDQQIQWNLTELSKIEPPSDRGIILCNPPYGKRIGNPQVLGSLYQLLGDVLKQRFKGWTAYILTGNKELAQQIGLRTSRRLKVYNGNLACTLLKYELY